ncbi:hypothetical protein B0H10DRAFT_1959237 [Mycena sp. CBHHK59/15]|nr:hypothetical protein B0H10DRAFT_1959237 [Mycena sp. CBHHK59/15]
MYRPLSSAARACLLCWRYKYHKCGGPHKRGFPLAIRAKNLSSATLETTRALARGTAARGREASKYTRKCRKKLPPTKRCPPRTSSYYNCPNITRVGPLNRTATPVLESGMWFYQRGDNEFNVCRPVVYPKGFGSTDLEGFSRFAILCRNSILSLPSQIVIVTTFAMHLFKYLDIVSQPS